MATGQRSRRYFSREFKAETVESIRSSGRSIPDICRDLDLTETTVRNWVRQARVDAGEVDGSRPTSARSCDGCGRRTGRCGWNGT
jgi:transposase